MGNSFILSVLILVIAAFEASGQTTAVGYYNRGHGLIKEKNYDAAIADLTKALELDPELWQALLLRCQALKEKNDLGRALADCTRAIKINPASAMAFYGRGDVHHTANDFDKAISDFSKALEIDSKLVRPTPVAASREASVVLPN